VDEALGGKEEEKGKEGGVAEGEDALSQGVA
jgi:hypothetical protein